MDQVWPIGCEGNSTMQATVIFPSPVSVLLYRNTREGCRSYLRTRISPSIMNGGWVAEQSVFVPSMTWIDCRVGAVFSVPRPVVFCVSAWRRSCRIHGWSKPQNPIRRWRCTAGTREAIHVRRFLSSLWPKHASASRIKRAGPIILTGVVNYLTLPNSP